MSVFDAVQDAVSAEGELALPAVAVPLTVDGPAGDGGGRRGARHRNSAPAGDADRAACPSDPEDSRVVELGVVDDDLGQSGWIDFRHVEALGG